MSPDPELGSDSESIWREDEPGARTTIAFDEIVRVTAGRLDCVTRIDTTVELDHASGHYIELSDAWRGFDEVMMTMEERLVGFDRTWRTKVFALQPGQEPVLIWSRQVDSK